MLRLKSLFLLSAFLLTATFFALPRRVGSTSSIRQVTNTPDEVINLNPSLSDSGLVIAFESTSDLANVGGVSSFHALRADVSAEAAAFTDLGRTRAVSPSLSSDGSRLVFASTEDLVGQNPDRNSEIYLFDGSAVRQLTHTLPSVEERRLNDGNFQPTMSGDGRLVAFSSNRSLAGLNSSSSDEIFLLDTEIQIFTQLTTTASQFRMTSPKISGDGSRVYSIRQHKDKSSTGDLIVYYRTTGTTQLLATNVAELSFSEGRATSNDGMRLVYSANTAPNQSQVFLFDGRDNSIRCLTQLDVRTTDVQLQPTVSGDGKRIAFATRRRVVNPTDGSVELYLLDLPSGQFQQVTDAPASATAEVVSSLDFAGSRVAFNFPRVLSAPVDTSDHANNSEIYLVALAPRPQFGVVTVQNDASKGNEPGQTTRIAGGSIAILKGSSLALATEQTFLSAQGPPFSSLGTTVSVNGEPARILFVSPGEVIFVVPLGVSHGPAEFVVTNSEGFSSRAVATASSAAPGIFTIQGDGRGEGVLLDADTLLPGPFDPSKGQLRLMVFATGVFHALDVSATIGGQPVQVEVVTTTNLPGLDEVYLLVPAHLRGAGTVPLIITADGLNSNAVSLGLTGNPLRDIMINEFLADPPDGIAGDANHDGVRDTSDDEFVELVNTTTRDLNISGYQLQTRSSNALTDTTRHRFAMGTILAAGTSIVVFGGGDPNQANPVFGGSQLVKTSTSGLSLTNSGGIITLRDVSGSVATSVTYGSSVGVRGDANQSVTRSPDITGDFSVHSVAQGSEARLFSPGTRLNGAPFLPTPAVSLITLSPALNELLPGGQVQFIARAFDQNNQELSDVIFSWLSSATTVLEIDAQGLAKAVGPGASEVTAIGRGVSSAPSRVVVREPSPTPTPTPAPTPFASPSPGPTLSPTPTSSPSPVPTPTPSPVTSASLVISEFRTRGPNGASDEFIEIYNRTSAPVDISGWKIRSSSNSGSITTRLIINAGSVLPAGGHFLATNSNGYSGTIAGDQSYTSGVGNDGGLALTLPDDTIVDQVGLSASSAFREGLHLPPLPSDANQSYERRPGGSGGSTQDTEDNFSDFQLLTPADPQNTQSLPTPGASPNPTPTGSPTPQPTPSPSPGPSPNPPPQIVVSQLFGGGGNAGAPYRNDYVEIFNRSQSSVNLTGWSIQYASATASKWNVTSLTSIELAPGQYYLIQEASGGNNGVSLPTPDATGSIAMAASAGKVALVKRSTALVGVCPNDSDIVDLVGYGAAGCFEGAGSATAPSNINAILRVANGCTDAGNNSVDFLTGTPNPRNSTSLRTTCASALSTLVEKIYGRSYLEHQPVTTSIRISAAWQRSWLPFRLGQ